MSPGSRKTRAVALRRAVGPDDLAEIRRLFEEYAASLPIDLGFQGFDEELAALPGKYGPPQGALLLATVGGEAAGCAALRPIGDGTCEMKRLFVRDRFRGRGLGRSLADAVLAEARALGYRAVRLDTLRSMESAQALYESYGFRDIGPYVYNPHAEARYMELVLPPAPPEGTPSPPPEAPAPPHGAAELREAERALASLLAKLEKVVPKLAPGSAQRTLAERRVRALALSLDLVREALAEAGPQHPEGRGIG